MYFPSLEVGVACNYKEERSSFPFSRLEIGGVEFS